MTQLLLLISPFNPLVILNSSSNYKNAFLQLKSCLPKLNSHSLYFQLTVENIGCTFLLSCGTKEQVILNLPASLHIGEQQVLMCHFCYGHFIAKGSTLPNQQATFTCFSHLLTNYPC